MRGDNPITSSAEDRLDRSVFAEQIAAVLSDATADHGLVVALMGPWGIGKTSVLNMVQEKLSVDSSRTVLTFNPWMFSGREQLVGVFFEQLSAQLRLNKGNAERAVADLLVDYGQALQPLVFVPIAGPWIARAGSIGGAAGRLLQSRKKIDPIAVQRQQIEQALARLPDPIFVIVDDIDRLSSQEIRDMFALVRLTAHFPRVIYLLAFDRAKVERALSNGGQDDGRSYLDKIVEVCFDLPAISRSSLERILLEGLDQATTGIATGPLDQGRWTDVFYRVVLPLVATPREVNRYLAPLHATLHTVGEEVALVDVLALEAVRLRLPEVFEQLRPISDALTAVGMRTSQSVDWQPAITAFTQSGGQFDHVVVEFCRLLFPATERYLGGNMTYGSEWLPRWRKERRVANPEVLSFYLSRLLPPGAVPAAIIERAVESLADRSALKAVVDGLSETQLEDLLARLVAFQDEFSPDAALPACAVLLGLYPRLRTRHTGLLDPGREFAVDRVVLRLLERVPAGDQRSAIVAKLCSEGTSFTGRIRLLELAGRRSNPRYERLIPAAESDRLFQQVCSEIRHGDAEQIAAERDPLGLLATALAEDPSDRDDVDGVLEDSNVAAAVIGSSVAHIRSQAQGSLAVQSQSLLRWELLRTVAGEDDAIAQLATRSTDKLAERGSELADAVDLVRQYLDGWRPPSMPFAGRPLVPRPPLSSPGQYFSPNLGSGWPALHVRAVTSYEVDPLWATQTDLSGRDFHDRLAAVLTSAPMADKTALVARARNLPAQFEAWRPDPDGSQNPRAAVARRVIGPDDHPTAVLRYAVFLRDNSSGSTRLIADIFVSPTEPTDTKWAPLQLADVHELLTAALDTTNGETAETIMRGIYGGEMPPRTTVELYLTAAQGQSGGRSVTLASMIDLDPLGASTRPDMPPLQGLFAVDGEAPTSTTQDRRYVCSSALIRMALDWGYLDAPAALQQLASASQ